MKFKILVRNIRGEWWEEYEKKTDNPQAWADETVRNFNNTRRKGERLRELVRVEVGGTSSSRRNRLLFACKKCGEEVGEGEEDHYGHHGYCGGELDPIGEIEGD